MITLSKMTSSQFSTYLNSAVADYAKDKIEAGTWLKKEALSLAEKTFNSLLPEGIHTPNHYLFTISLDKKIIGFIWLNFVPENQLNAFIYDFIVFDDYQGFGYGQETMREIEIIAKKLGAKQLSLHVFGHNQRALHVYEKVGFHITDYSLSKNI